MSIQASRLQVDVEANTKDAQKDLAGLGKTVKDTPQQFNMAKNAAMALGGGLALAGAGALTLGIKQAAANQQAQISFEALLGSGTKAKTFLGQLTTFAASTPFDLPGVEKAAQQLLGVGYTSQQVIPFLTAFGNTSSALSLSSEQFGSVMQQTTQAIANGKFQIGDLSALASNGIPIYKLLSEAMHKPTSAIMDMASKGKLLAGDVMPLLQKQMNKDYGGAMAKQSQTLTGLWSTLQDTLAQSLANAFQPLVPILTKAMPGAIDTMGKAIQAAGPIIASVVQVITGTLIPALTKAFGFISDHQTAFKVVAAILTTFFVPAMIRAGVTAVIEFGKVRLEALKAAAAAWKSSAKMVAGWTMSAAAAVRSGAQTVAVWTMYRVEAMKGAAAQVAQGLRVIGSWIAMGAQAALAAAKVVAGWVLMGATAIAQGAIAVARMAVTVAATVGGWIVMAATSLASAAAMAAAWFIALGPVGWVIALVVGLVILIIANWSKVKAFTIAAFNAVKDGVVNAFHAVVNFVSSAVAAIVNWVKSHWQLLLGIIAGPLGLIVGYVISHWNQIKAFIANALAAIQATISRIWNGVVSFISGAMSRAQSIVSGAWNRIKSAVSSAASGLWAIVRGIPGGIVRALGNLGSMLYNSGKSIIQGLVNGIRDMAGSVKDAVGGVLQSARNLLPFSPAKEGPFSGKGWTLHSGRSISQALAQGITDNHGLVKDAALGMAHAAVPPLPGVTVPSLAFGAATRAPGAPGGVPSVGALGRTAAGTARGGVTLQFNTYNPVAEPQSVTTNKGLQRVAAVGLV